MILAKNALLSSVGKKLIVSISGLGISVFVLMHMSGNLLMYISPEAYNRYGHNMTTNPIFPLIEIGLLLVFLVHIVMAILLAVENKQARPVSPHQQPSSSFKRAFISSRTMIFTGLLTLAFLVLHVLTFRFGTHYEVQYGDLVVRDLYRLMVEKFQQPLFTTWYLFSLVILGTHLRHGISSLFQTLGATGVRSCWVQKIAWGFAILVAGGFFTQPIYIFLTHR